MKSFVKILSLSGVVGLALAIIILSCSKTTSTATAPTSSASEVAVAATSGSVNAGDTTVGWNDPIPNTLRQVLNF